MKVYRVEMKQNDKWKIGRVPFGSLHGTRSTRDQAAKDLEQMKLRWQTNKAVADKYPDQIPTDWRIMEREETEWVESK